MLCKVLRLLLVCAAGLSSLLASRPLRAAGPHAPVLALEAFLPENYVRDGSLSYQVEIQRALDTAAERGQALRFPRATFAVDERGWRLHSQCELIMTGATFRVSADAGQDGAVFSGESVSHVTLTGGEIVGRNDVWGDGVNIRGVHMTGVSSDIAISGMRIREMSSNGIGIFGTAESPIRDVRIRDVIIDHCCNRYPDYLSGEKWEQGSVREDQGLIACYHVDDFVVHGCRLVNSRSDGTHFDHCRRGHITDNQISRAKMGGYFLESCDEVIGRGNLMRENGSRGTTIERGSKNCVFADNVVVLSGREGLWAPDCFGLVVSGNVFDRNGRKPNGEKSQHIWNANITINEARGDPANSPTRDYLISQNLIRSTSSQIAAIRIDATAEGETTQGTSNIVLSGNVLTGENQDILIEGPRRDTVRLLNQPH